MKNTFFHFVLLSAACTNVLNTSQQGRCVPPVGITNGVRCPRVGNTYSWYSCICKSRHRALTCKCRLRGRVAPKLACVQDIRPHVPELGCTSAVQNEKIHFFHFCTAECSLLAWHVHLERKLAQGATRPPSALHQLGVRYPKLAILYSWYSCICKSRHRALTCKYPDARTRRPQVSLRSRH